MPDIASDVSDEILHAVLLNAKRECFDLEVMRIAVNPIVALGEFGALPTADQALADTAVALIAACVARIPLTRDRRLPAPVAVFRTKTEPADQPAVRDSRY